MATGNTSSMSVTEEEAVHESNSLVFLISFYWQLTVSSSAVLLNLIVLVTFVRVSDLLPPATRVLVIHQTVLELLCSVLAIIWQEGQHAALQFPAGWFGRALCVLWSSMYWIVVYCVQVNSVAITVDRYLAVCHPMRRVLTSRRALLAVALSDAATVGVKYATQYRMYGLAGPQGQCVALPPEPGQLFAWGIYFTAVYYLAPLAAVACLYPPMVRTIVQSRKRFAASGSAQDSAKRRSAARLVRTCLVAAAALIVAEMPSLVFFNISYCLLGLSTVGFGAYQDALNTIFTSSYPFLSPIIYSFSTPKFRQSISCRPQ